jgi:hypothetical protein
MMTNVYRAGAVVATIPVDEGATCKRTIAGVDEITMDVVQSNGSLAVMIGDYIVFEGNNYFLNRPAKIEKKSIVEYHFSLTFEADIYSLLNKLFQQPVTGRGDFGLVDTLEGFVDVLLSNINGIESGWTKGVIPASERKLMVFDGETCRAVLNRLADEFDVEFNVVGKQISFYDLYENATSLVFEHGQGKGLYELTRDNVDSNNTVTRGWFWGANKNIDYSYRDGETRLVFTNPVTGTNRIDNFGDFSKSVEKQIIFEDVWPQFTGTIATVSNDALSGIHSFTCPSIDFDVTLQMIEGVAPKIFFKSGDLQSQEFEIKSYDHPTRTITLITYTDEFGQVWPNASFFPKTDNQFTFIGLKMPESYVVAAEAKLAEKAAEWMDYYSKLRVKYSLDLDPRYLRSNAITLNRGDVVRIIDASLGIDKQIRITSIEKNVENPYKVKCEISNILEERWEKKISKQVQEALNNSKTANEKVSSTTLAIGSFFGRYFEVRGTSGNEYICAKLPFASVGEVSAYASSGFVIPSLWDALPTASATIKGGIRIGSGLSIDENGIVTVTSQGTIQTLSLNGTTLSISGGNSVTIPATYTDVMARAACAASGTVYDSARLAGVAASSYTRRDVNEAITGQWAFNNLSFSGELYGKNGTKFGYADGTYNGIRSGTHSFFVNNQGDTTRLMTIFNEGNVRIGNSDAAISSRLHVDGDIRGNWHRATSTYGFYIEDAAVYYTHNGTMPEMSSGNNELCFSCGYSIMYVNYTQGRIRTVPTKWIWNAGAGLTSFAEMEMGRAVVHGANPIRMIGSSAGYANNAFIAIYENNGTTRQGWIGNGYSDRTSICLGNDISGKIMQLHHDGNLYYDGSVGITGNILATGEVTTYSASDRRLKTNIKTITNASDILRQLRAVEYDWNETAMRLNPSKRDAPHSVSFIAQEWEHLLPWATHSIFGKYKSIDKDVMHGYLVAGWNEHDKKLTTHDKEIKQLRQRIRELENQLNKP